LVTEVDAERSRVQHDPCLLVALRALRGKDQVVTIRTSAQSRNAKAAGRDTENRVVQYLRDRGYRVERRRTTGVEDCGDLVGLESMVVEIKKGGPAAAASGLNELSIEVQNANARFPDDAPHSGILVCRRKGKPFAGDWYCIVRLEQMVDWLPALGWTP
jgi:hypothetical protein